MQDASWTSLVTPLLTIFLAVTTRQVLLSLFIGICVGSTQLSGSNPVIGANQALQRIADVFSSPENVKLIMFTILIGALIASIEISGGVRGVIHFLERRRWVSDGFRTQWLAWIIGIFIFIESNMTLLVSGTICRPLFDRYSVAREKLAYIIDSTCAPVCVLIPVNAWGAFIVGLVAATGVSDPLSIFVQSIPFSFYSFAAVFLTAIVIAYQLDIGEMRIAEETTMKVPTQQSSPSETISAANADAALLHPNDGEVRSAAFMAVPVIVMIAMVPTGLAITGGGKLSQGAAATSILGAVTSALIVSWVMNIVSGKLSVNEMSESFITGAQSLLPISMILVLALALSDLAFDLRSGDYLAGIASESVARVLITPLVFAVAASIAFSVGSSWGTFAIVVPIIAPLSLSLSVPFPILLGATISGGVFGDHCSPISDTTIIASLAAGTEHMDHVRTQLPYAGIAAAMSLIGYLVVGLFL